MIYPKGVTKNTNPTMPGAAPTLTTISIRCGSSRKGYPKKKSYM